MSNVKISALPAATTPLTGTELVPLVQSGVTSQVAVSNIKTAPAGSNTQVQFNNSSAFGASASLTWDGTSLTATKLAGAHNGTVGATTPSTGAFTTLSASSTVSAAGSTTIDSSGNLGVGATAPSTWGALAVRKAVTVSGRSVSGSFSDASTGTMDIAHASGYVALDTQATGTALRIAQAGTINGQFNQYGLGIGSGVPSSGMGITFPATQSASTDANTLDDYEEGTWTPTLAFGGGSTGIVYGGRVGNYIKVGSLITAQCAVDITNKGSSTGSASVSGFPFTVSGTFITIIGSQLVSWTGAGPCQLLLSSGTTASFYGIPNGVGLGWTALTNTDFANTSQFYFTMVYKV
jgi:hypothetical protein